MLWWRLRSYLGKRQQEWDGASECSARDPAASSSRTTNIAKGQPSLDRWISPKDTDTSRVSAANCRSNDEGSTFVGFHIFEAQFLIRVLPTCSRRNVSNAVVMHIGKLLPWLLSSLGITLVSMTILFSFSVLESDSVSKSDFLLLYPSHSINITYSIFGSCSANTYGYCLTFRISLVTGFLF